MGRTKRRLVIKDRQKMAKNIALALLAVIAAAGLAVLAVFMVKKLRNKFTPASVPIYGAESICGTGDGILCLRSGVLDFYSYRDEDENFEKRVDPSASASGVAGSAGIKVVYAENALDIVGSDFDTAPEGRVTGVRCGRTHAAVLTRAADGSDTITVYTSASQKIASFEYAAGSLMDFGFSEASGSTLWTMELSTASGTPRTTVSTFDLDRMSSTGVITVSGQLVERVFFTGQSVFVVGTESLIRYSSSANREVYRVQLYGWRVLDVSLSGEAPLLLLMPRSAASISECSTARLLTVHEKDVPSEKAASVVLPSGTVGCSAVNGSLMVVAEHSVALYDASGERKASRSFPEGLTVGSQKLDEHHILLERSGEYILLTVGK